MSKLWSFFDARPRWQLMLICVGLLIVLGGLDHASGYELSFSVFYLAPISVAAWFGGGRSVGLFLSVLAAVVWLAVDYTSGHVYSQGWILYWNAGVRLAFFCVVTLLLAELRRRLGREKMLARSDALTGLRNAYAFKEDARLFFGLAARGHHPITVGYIDVDNFKAVNDTLGHSEGDRVLAGVAATIAGSIRATDIAGRLGGDEFAVLSPDTDLAGAQALFSKLREQLSGLVQAHGWPIGFSVGVAVFPDPLPDFDAALRQADALMYRVKHGGKNSVCYECFNSGGIGSAAYLRTGMGDQRGPGA